jgi:hypothetical protein
VLIFKDRETKRLGKKNSARYYVNKHRFQRKVPVIIVRFQSYFNFLYRFSKNPQISILVKIHPVPAELFHADRWTDERTDMTKLMVTFHNFMNASVNIQPGQPVDTATRLHDGHPGYLGFLQSVQIQPHIQRISVELSPRVRWPRREADYSSHIVPRLSVNKSYTSTSTFAVVA